MKNSKISPFQKNKNIISKPIFPCLWYDGKSREAADFYCQIFPNSKILSDNGMVVKFELNGREFMGLNGGPNFKFDEAVSFCIECETQEEIDYYWENLLNNGGQEKVCGWLTDQFGMCWQVYPKILVDMMNDAEKAPKAVEAFQKMVKFDIQALLDAVK